ncbi:MAG TPA: hypothetical protein VI216_03135 [Candidatus Acidoferrales bacterium]
MADVASTTVTSAGDAILTITGAGLAGAETSMTAEISVAGVISTADAIATFTAAATSMVDTEGTSTAVTDSVAVDTVEEVSTVDTVATDSMAAMAEATADIGKFLRAAHLKRPAARSAGRFLFGSSPAREHGQASAGGENPMTRNAFVVATVLGVIECE